MHDVMHLKGQSRKRKEEEKNKRQIEETLEALRVEEKTTK